MVTKNFIFGYLHRHEYLKWNSNLEELRRFHCRLKTDGFLKCPHSILSNLTENNVHHHDEDQLLIPFMEAIGV
jgi:hypothetical protein